MYLDRSILALLPLPPLLCRRLVQVRFCGRPDDGSTSPRGTGPRAGTVVHARAVAGTRMAWEGVPSGEATCCARGPSLAVGWGDVIAAGADATAHAGWRWRISHGGGGRRMQLSADRCRLRRLRPGDRPRSTGTAFITRATQRRIVCGWDAPGCGSGVPPTRGRFGEGP